MKSLILFALFAMLTLSACVVTPSNRVHGGVIVAPLPAIVVLGADPYYYQNGYYYYYQNNNWRYSNTRSGPWMDLPRSHWPKEIRYKDRNRDRDDSRDRDYKPGYNR